MGLFVNSDLGGLDAFVELTNLECYTIVSMPFSGVIFFADFLTDAIELVRLMM